MPDHAADSPDAGSPAPGSSPGSDAPKHAAEPAPARPPRTRAGRRASTDAPVGSDPTPFPEPPRHLADENDDRLKRDKPPHWG